MAATVARLGLPPCRNLFRISVLPTLKMQMAISCSGG